MGCNNSKESTPVVEETPVNNATPTAESSVPVPSESESTTAANNPMEIPTVEKHTTPPPDPTTVTAATAATAATAGQAGTNALDASVTPTTTPPTATAPLNTATSATPPTTTSATPTAATVVEETAATTDTAMPTTTVVEEAFKYTAPDGKGFNKKGDYRKYMFATYYSFSNRENEFLAKKSGDIDGQAFNLSRLTNCEVQLLDHSDQVLADYLTDCRIFIGPSAGSVFLRNCTNCSITVAAKQLRTRDCSNCRFYVYSKTEPVIEMTENVEIRRFNGQYEGMDAHFKAANLNRSTDNWHKIHDFSLRDKDLGPVPHFKLIKLVPTVWTANGERTTERPRLNSVSTTSAVNVSSPKRQTTKKNLQATIKSAAATPAPVVVPIPAPSVVAATLPVVVPSSTTMESVPFEIPEAVAEATAVAVVSGTTDATEVATETTTIAATAETTDTAMPTTTVVEEAFKYTAPDGKGFNKKGDYRKYMFATYYSFSNRENEFLAKKSGDIDGQAFNLSRLTNCEVQLLDHSDQVLADYLTDCRIFIGPSAGSVFLRNCTNCSITVAAKQLRTRDCSNCRFYVYSKTEPVIEMTENVEIRRFNGQYEGMDAHFKAANLNRSTDNWHKIHDFSLRDKDLGPVPHFKLIKLVPTAWTANGERTTERPRLNSTTSG